MKDTARVLGRMYDGIEYRGYGQEIVETLARYAGFLYGTVLPMNFTRPGTGRSF
jgi:hypothetical protein